MHAHHQEAKRSAGDRSDDVRQYSMRRSAMNFAGGSGDGHRRVSAVCARYINKLQGSLTRARRYHVDARRARVADHEANVRSAHTGNGPGAVDTAEPFAAVNQKLKPYVRCPPAKLAAPDCLLRADPGCHCAFATVGRTNQGHLGRPTI